MPNNLVAIRPVPPFCTGRPPTRIQPQLRTLDLVKPEFEQPNPVYVNRHRTSFTPRDRTLEMRPILSRDMGPDMDPLSYEAPEMGLGPNHPMHSGRGDLQRIGSLQQRVRVEQAGDLSAQRRKIIHSHTSFSIHEEAKL
jgi:hypothetical protein